MTCLYCERKLTKQQKKFCSIQHQKEYEYNLFIGFWLSTPGYTSETVSNHIRRYLFEQYNACCQQCGWGTVNPYTGNCPLEIDHIDGNYLNNTRSNLRLLCPNCHSLTETYRGLNRGYGRGTRKKMYG